MSERGQSPGALRISSTESDPDGVRLALAGELDLAGAPQLERSLQMIEQRSPRRVVIDLAGLSFIDSTGLRVLLQAQTRLGEQGSELLLRPGEPAVQRVFDVTGATRVLRFEGSRGERSERSEGFEGSRGERSERSERSEGFEGSRGERSERPSGDSR